MKRAFSHVLVLLVSTLCVNRAQKPNIILIYTDDVGYGDVGCYEGSKTPTPHIDRLAKEGLKFTDAHCSAATCTPSRFAMLTGQYAFRQKGTGIASGNAGPGGKATTRWCRSRGGRRRRGSPPPRRRN